MNPLNIQNKIKFKTVELKVWEVYKITWKNEIITVIYWKIYEKLKWTIKTFESSVYHAEEVEAVEDNSYCLI